MPTAPFFWPENNHIHTVNKIVDGENVRYMVGPQRNGSGQVRFTGRFVFLTRTVAKGVGINVGENGNTAPISAERLRAVIWTFDNITANRFHGGLPVEMTIGVYRSHKGILSGQLWSAGPEPGNGLT